MYILSLCVLVAFLPDFSTACGPDPSKWTPQEREMYECLKSKGWSNDQMLAYYNRVFKPETRSGRASRHDQYIVRGCLAPEDFLHYGVIPDGYTTTTTTTTPRPDNFLDVTYRERRILLCLRANGMTDQLIRAWYNRALKSATRSGQVSRHDQDLAINCIQPAGYLSFGVTPEGHTTTTTTTTTTTQAPTTTLSTTTSLTGSTPLEQKMFDCLRAKLWSDRRIQKWYDRVLNPETRNGRATQYDQDLVLGCVDIKDYLYYGVTPDGYSPSTSSPVGSQSPSGPSGGVTSSPTTKSSNPSQPPTTTVSGNRPPSG